MNGEAHPTALICPLISEEMSDSEQSLEAVVIEVENAAEVIRLATAAALRNGATTKRYSAPKQSG
jgi:hypothetical protein